MMLKERKVNVRIGFTLFCSDRDVEGTTYKNKLVNYPEEASVNNPATWSSITLTSTIPCYEFEKLEYDVDSNCKVNFSDYALFADEWLKCNDPTGIACQ